MNYELTRCSVRSWTQWRPDRDLRQFTASLKNWRNKQLFILCIQIFLGSAEFDSLVSLLPLQSIHIIFVW